MTPGDAWVDPLIKRGEELERIAPEVRTISQTAELESLKAYARSRIAHLAAYPLAASSIEESVQDLADEEARSAREREQCLADARKLIEPAVDAALAALVAGLKR
jgi:hypothetical protein